MKNRLVRSNFTSGIRQTSTISSLTKEVVGDGLLGGHIVGDNLLGNHVESDDLMADMTLTQNKHLQEIPDHISAIL